MHLEWFDPHKIGQVAARVLYSNASAKSCVEMALLDILAQIKQESLFSFVRRASDINTQEKPQPLAILRMLAGTLEQEIADAIALRAQGYRHWKIKVGLMGLQRDLERVAAICEVLEGDTISADANGAYSLDEAIAFCSSPWTSKLSFVEQPIASAHPISDFLALKRASALLIGLDESIHGLSEITEFDEARACDGASLKLIKLGGVLPGVRTALEMQRRKLQLNLACKVAETSLSAAATASIGFAVNGAAWGLSMSNEYLEFDICDNPLAAQGGLLHVEQLNPIGVGVIPNLTLVKEAVSKEWSVIQF